MLRLGSWFDTSNFLSETQQRTSFVGTVWRLQGHTLLSGFRAQGLQGSGFCILAESPGLIVTLKIEYGCGNMRRPPYAPHACGSWFTNPISHECPVPAGLQRRCPTFYRHFHHLTGPTYPCQKTKPGSISLNLGPFFLAAPLNSSAQLKQDYPTLFLESKPSALMIRALSWQDFAHSSLL